MSKIIKHVEKNLEHISNYSYILISCDYNSLNEVLNQLRRLKGVKEFQGTLGPWDIIVKSNSDKKLQQFIVKQIGAWIGVRSVLVLACKPTHVQ